MKLFLLDNTKSMRCCWLLLVTLSNAFCDTNDEDLKMRSKHYEEHLRGKRQINSLPLVYPYGATTRFILGLVSPMKLEDKISLIFGASFLYQYTHFTNITELSQYYAINTISRDQRSLDLNSREDERLVFYKAAEELLNVKGFNGRDCVLRAICEATQYPVLEEGLLGELMHILLTPNYGHSSFEETDEYWKDSMSDYIDAYTAGSQMFSCPFIYKGCPEGEGIMELVSVLRDE